MPVLNAVEITYTGHPATLTARLERGGVVEGLKAALRHWYREYAPGHFTTEAAGKYGYKDRGKKYMLRKAKKYGHQRPLEWTGTSRQQLLAMMALRGRGASSGRKEAVARFTAPRYFWYSPVNAMVAQARKLARGGRYRMMDQPHKSKEFMAMTSDELADLAWVANMEIVKQLNDAAQVVQRKRLGAAAV